MALTARSVLRGTLFGVLGLVGLLLLIGLSWVASNWADDAPQPTPPQLVLAPSQAGSPLFFQVQGMLAPAGEMPEAAGRADWRRITTVPAPTPAASAPSQLLARLAAIKGLPLSCRAPDNCPTVLSTSAAQVVAQLQPHALLGERCVAALANPAYVEELPAVIDATMTLPSYVGAVQCELWFKGQALVAAAQGDRAATLLRLQQGSLLVRSMLTGGRLLISQMIASAMARSHYDAITAIALLQPGWASTLMPLTAPLPPEALDATRWVTTESAFIRGTLDMTFTACAKGSDMLTASEESIFGMGSALACKTGIGLLPNATRQALDRRWLPMWQAAQQGLGTALAQAIDEQAKAAAAGSGTAGGLAWRNTVGRMLVDVAAPDFAPYFARQADVDLHRQALALGLAAATQKVPPADRVAWLQQQTVPSALKSRLAWVDNNAVLTAKPWLADVAGNDPRKAPIRVPLAAF